MKYGIIIAAAAIAASALTVNPAFSAMAPCSGNQLSKMTTMMASMPDGPHKWQMYKHLETVNTAMSKDGMRGCDATMKKMHRHMHHTRHMKQM